MAFSFITVLVEQGDGDILGRLWEFKNDGWQFLFACFSLQLLRDCLDLSERIVTLSAWISKSKLTRVYTLGSSGMSGLRPMLTFKLVSMPTRMYNKNKTEG